MKDRDNTKDESCLSSLNAGNDQSASSSNLNIQTKLHEGGKST